jgi:hypothetical protein
VGGTGQAPSNSRMALCFFVLLNVFLGRHKERKTSDDKMSHVPLGSVRPSMTETHHRKREKKLNERNDLDLGSIQRRVYL